MYEPEDSAEAIVASVGGTLARAALTTTPLSVTQWRESSVGLRSALMEVQYQYSQFKNLRYCQRACIPNKNPIYDNEGIHNVITCDNSLCMRCGRLKEEDNARTLQNIISNTNEEYSYFIGTLTFSTDCGVDEQASSLQKAYSKWIQTVRRKYKYRGATFHTSWSNDLTVSTTTNKVHLHRHFICRVPKGYEGGIGEMLYSSWESTVRRHTDRHTVSTAFYVEPIANTDAAIKYLYKSVREQVVQSNKNTDGVKLSWFGLVKAIHEGAEHLVGLYRDILSGLRGKRWFGVSKAMRADYVEEEDTAQLVAEDEENKRVITPIEGTPMIHNAICNSGALGTLRCVLATGRDGDLDVESFRALVDKWRPILHRNCEDGELLDAATIEFYQWAEQSIAGIG